MLPPIVRLVAVLALLVPILALHTVDWKKTQVLVAYDAALVNETSDLAALLGLDAEKYQLSYVDYASDDAELFLGEDALFHHAVYLPSTKKIVAAKEIVNKHKLLEFFNKGGNVLAVGDGEHQVPDDVRTFLAQAGVHVAPKGFVVETHFGALDLGADNVVPNRIVAAAHAADYSGAAALLSNSELVVPLVRAPALSFCADPKAKALASDKTWTFGEQGFLAAAFQGLNNARGAWVGLPALLLRELVAWVFQERGVLKLHHVQHYRKDEPGLANRTLYRVNNDVYYTVAVSELVDGEWVPYTPAAADDVLQLSFKMLDPYQRLNLTLLGAGASVENGAIDSSIFYVEFTIPNQHGMFTFELDYKRPGLTFLEDKRVVAVKHLANDEFRRSWEITNSWMYMASAAAVVVAWLAFVANFLFLRDAPAVETVETVEIDEKKVEKAEKAEKAEKKKSEKKAEKKEKAEKTEK